MITRQQAAHRKNGLLIAKNGFQNSHHRQAHRPVGGPFGRDDLGRGISHVMENFTPIPLRQGQAARGGEGPQRHIGHLGAGPERDFTVPVLPYDVSMNVADRHIQSAGQQRSKAGCIKNGS